VRHAAGVERTLDHEVALGEEQPGPGVVALAARIASPRSLSRKRRTGDRHDRRS
jgi:hypothetical protein